MAPDFNFFDIMLPFAWEHADKPVRMAGTSTDAYQKMLEGVLDHAKMADRLNFEGIIFSEQHGNLEGVHELTNNPVMLDMFVAANTERIKVGQCGMVLPVSNPLLVAEEIAQLDQITRGRTIAGFSRGNTSRWCDQFGQLNGMKAAASDKGEDDERNLRAFKEAWEIIRLAWTEDIFSYEGEFWTYPVPGTKYPYPAAKEWGPAIAEDDSLLGVGVTPRPYQKPYPRVLAPVSGRTAMVHLWAQAGNTIVSFAGADDFNEHIAKMYHEEAQKAGHNVEFGENLILGGCLCLSRDPAKAAQYEREFTEWYVAHYSCPPYNLPLGRLYAGTPQQVIDQIGAVHERLNSREFLVLDNVGAPHGEEAALEMLQVFGEEVMPAFQSGTK